MRPAKITVVAGEVQVRVSGVRMTRKQARRLILDVVGLAATVEAEPERTAIGFAVTDPAPELEPEMRFTDDD